MNAEKTLEKTVKKMMEKGKGILAIDESLPTIKKRFDSINVRSTEFSRRDYRELLIKNPGGNEYISGMILFDETIRTSTKDGTTFPKVLSEQGILTGIKVDTGAKDFAGHPGEKITEGLDGLRGRLANYKDLGARFAKWRAVITISEDLPSAACIEANAHALANYAGLCQEAGIVPIVEPEVLMDADNTIECCNEVTSKTLRTLFDVLKRQGIMLEYTILKPNMIVAGKQCPIQADIAEVAQKTVQCLLGNVPPELAGIVFLSGGQSAILATAHLNEMNVCYPDLPWPLSFSFGRALQEPCLKAWQGESVNIKAARQALLLREKCNSMAALGRYHPEMEAA